VGREGGICVIGLWGMDAAGHLHYANDAKTFLKHFSDCLFYFCSTCADSINENKNLRLMLTNVTVSARTVLL